MPLENGISQQLRQARSPLAESLVVADDVKRYYEGLWPDMLTFYHAHAEMPDPELMIAIDNTFGERLVREVCEPLEFFQGACAFIGLILLRQSDMETAFGAK